MIYVLDGTSDCLWSHKPEIYDDLERATDSLFAYNENCGVETAYTLNRYESVEEWKDKLNFVGKFYDFTEEDK